MARIKSGRHAGVVATLTGVVVAALGLGVPAATAGATPAQKVPLTDTNRDCSGTAISPPSSTGSFGFAVTVAPASGKLVAAVALKGALPNATYDIRLIQVGGNPSDCDQIDGTLTTDATGDGNANVQERFLSGAGQAWVDLNNQANFGDFYDTQPVSFSGH